MSNRLNGFELEDNVETMFKVEPPLTPSKSEFGYVGVLLRDRNEDKIQCHLCGGWFTSLAKHVNMKHELSCAKYKEEFSLPPNFPLISFGLSERFARNAINNKQIKRLEKSRKHYKATEFSKRKQKDYYKTEAYLNSKGLCKKQMLTRYLAVADIVGRDPSAKELREHDPNLLYAIFRRFNNSLNKFRESYGLMTRGEKYKIMEESEIIGAIRDFVKKHHKVPSSKDFVKGSPNYSTIVKKFGSFRRALAVSGVI